MSIDLPDIVALLAEIRGSILGSRVVAALQPDAHTVVLRLRTPGREKVSLFFSTRPGCSRFHLVPDGPRGAAPPAPFAASLRAALRGARLEDLRQVRGDRLVEAAFSSGAPPHREVLLIQEIRESRGNLVLAGPELRIVAALHPLRREGRELAPGDSYVYPPPRPAAASRAPEGPSRPDDRPAEEPVRVRVAREYAVLEREAILAERKADLAGRLRRALDRLVRLEGEVRRDLEGLRGAEGLREKGELLKGALPTLRRGMDSVELDDWYRPPGSRIRVELDPALDPVENVERYFHRYRKLRRALPIVEARLSRIEEATARAAAAIVDVERAASVEDLDRLAEESRALLERGRRRRTAKGRARTEPAGPRRFRSADGHEILVGRSARENDELTARIARGNDLFFHVSGRPGAHVVLRTAPGKTASLEALLDAAQLAVYFSLPERSRGAIAAGASGEVDYTPAKHVRRPKGAAPGTVLLATHRTLRVRLEPERMERLLGGDLW